MSSASGCNIVKKHFWWEIEICKRSQQLPLWKMELNNQPGMVFANITPTRHTRAFGPWLGPFPKSRLRPSLISPVNPIKIMLSKAVKKWNFRKAN